MQHALGIDWTGEREELTEAIPPAYTTHIGAAFSAWHHHNRGTLEEPTTEGHVMANQENKPDAQRREQERQQREQERQQREQERQAQQEQGQTPEGQQPTQ